MFVHAALQDEPSLPWQRRAILTCDKIPAQFPIPADSCCAAASAKCTHASMLSILPSESSAQSTMARPKVGLARFHNSSDYWHGLAARPMTLPDSSAALTSFRVTHVSHTSVTVQAGVQCASTGLSDRTIRRRFGSRRCRRSPSARRSGSPSQPARVPRRCSRWISTSSPSGARPRISTFESECRPASTGQRVAAFQGLLGQTVRVPRRPQWEVLGRILFTVADAVPGYRAKSRW
jgi:hypothetical protein